MSTGKRYIVQQRKDDLKFEVIAFGAEKASFVFDTQAEGEAKADELNPDSRPNVRRVKYTSGGRPGEFRAED